MTKGGAERWQLFGAFAATYFFWGASFLAIRWAVEDFPPLAMIAIRCACGALLLGGWIRLTGQWAPVQRGSLIRAAAAGFFLFAGCHGLLAWAEQRVSSGQASMYLATIPIWLVGFDGLIRRRWPHPRSLLALALGTVGVALLTSGEGGGTLGERLGLVLSAASWALGSLIGRGDTSSIPTAQRSVLQLGAGALLVGALSFAAGEPGRWDSHAIGTTAIAALGFLIVFGTVVSFAAYTWLLSVVRPEAAGSYAYVNPLVALLLGVAVGDDHLTARVAAAAGLILAAVAVAQGIWRHRPRP